MGNSSFSFSSRGPSSSPDSRQRLLFGIHQLKAHVAALKQGLAQRDRYISLQGKKLVLAKDSAAAAAAASKTDKPPPVSPSGIAFTPYPSNRLAFI